MQDRGVLLGSSALCLTATSCDTLTLALMCKYKNKYSSSGSESNKFISPFTIYTFVQLKNSSLALSTTSTSCLLDLLLLLVARRENCDVEDEARWYVLALSTTSTSCLLVEDDARRCTLAFFLSRLLVTRCRQSFQTLRLVAGAKLYCRWTLSKAY